MKKSILARILVAITILSGIVVVVYSKVQLLSFCGDSLAIEATETENIENKILKKVTGNILGKVEVATISPLEKSHGKKLGKQSYQVSVKFFGLPIAKRKIVVDIEDTQPPVIYSSESIEVSQGTDIKKQQIFSAEDSVDGELSENSIKIDSFAPNQVGEQEVFISAVDSSGNVKKIKRKITVKDTVSPEFSGLSDTSINEGDRFDLLKGISAKDNSEGDLTKNIQVSGKVDTEHNGTYKLSYSVSDKAGNNTKKDRTVTVQRKKVESKQEKKNSEKIVSSETFTLSTTADKEEDPNRSTESSVSTIEFLGTVIPFIDCTGADEAPATGCGTWVGSGLVDDGQCTYFIGHNPGPFSGELSLSIGSAITVCDQNGHTKTYHIVESVDIDDYGNNLNDSSDNITDRALYASEEQIALQTCLSDSTNRVVIAK